MKRTIAALLVLSALTAAECLARQNKEDASSKNMAVELRKMILSSKTGATKGNQATVVIDTHAEEIIASLMSSTEGDASIYLSSGGVLIGGGQHDNVRKAAIAFSTEVLKHKSAMKPTTEFPYPGADNVRFYLRTRDGVYVIEVPESELASGKHELSASYAAAQKVIEEYNKAASSGK